jgi:hypothetical protein
MIYIEPERRKAIGGGEIPRDAGELAFQLYYSILNGCMPRGQWQPFFQQRLQVFAEHHGGTSEAICATLAAVSLTIAELGRRYQDRFDFAQATLSESLCVWTEDFFPTVMDCHIAVYGDIEPRFPRRLECENQST